MGIHTRIITIDEDVKHWPDKKMKKCTLLASDNSKYQADLLPEEVDLVMELNSLYKNKVLNQWQYESLVKKIDAFSDARWNEGHQSAEIDYEENN